MTDNDSHWVYLMSKEELPSAYAMEFEYTLNEEIPESLQICFFAESLADRHRIVLRDNRRMCFEIVKHGFWGKPLAEVPMRFSIGERHHIRLEVVESDFVFIVDGNEIFAMRSFFKDPDQTRLFLIFWNGAEAFGRHPIDAFVDKFQLYTI